MIHYCRTSLHDLTVEASTAAVTETPDRRGVHMRNGGAYLSGEVYFFHLDPLRSPGERWGAELDEQGDGLKIKNLGPGLFSMWNESMRKVFPQDCVGVLEALHQQRTFGTPSCWDSSVR